MIDMDGKDNLGEEGKEILVQASEAYRDGGVEDVVEFQEGLSDEEFLRLVIAELSILMLINAEGCERFGDETDESRGRRGVVYKLKSLLSSFLSGIR